MNCAPPAWCDPYHCMRDPWGSFAQYFHDIDYIPEGCPWVARDFPSEDALYKWGPRVPDDFARSREIE
jgi:hypothetical protein